MAIILFFLLFGMALLLGSVAGSTVSVRSRWNMLILVLLIVSTVGDVFVPQLTWVINAVYFFCTGWMVMVLAPLSLQMVAVSL